MRVTSVLSRAYSQIVASSRRSGAGLRVRKKQFSPMDLSGLGAWYKADAATSLISDGAIQFASASSQQLNASNGTQLSFGNTAYTVAAWVNLTSLVAQSIITKHGPANQGEWILQYSSSAAKFRYYVFDGTNAASVDFTGVTPATGTWYLVAASWDPATGTVAISVNGAAWQTSVAGITPVAQPTIAFSVGGRSNSVEFANSTMDSAGVWNRRLSASELSTLYNSGAGYSYVGLPSALMTGLVSWWNLGELSGTRYDSVGTVHLTPVNAPTATAGIVSGYASNGDPIKQWLDLSGNGRHMQQTVHAQKPVLVTSGSDTLSGKPTVSFDGVDDGLSGISAALNILNGVAGWTVFTALQSRSNAGTNNVAWFIGTGGNAVRAQWQRSTNQENLACRRLDADTLVSVFTGSYSTGVANLVTGLSDFSNGRLLLRKDGSVLSDTNPSSVGAVENVNAGSVYLGRTASGQYFPGSISELIIFTRALTATEIALVEQYLAQQYSPGLSIATQAVAMP